MFEVLNLLNRDKKKKFYLMTLFLIIGMLLDIFSLAILVPLIELILGNSSNFLTEKVIDISTYFNYGNTLVLFSVFVVFIFFIKTIYSLYLTYRQNRFISNLIKETNNKLFSFYLNQKFIYHSENNSAEVIRNLNTDLNHFASYLRSIIFLFTEIGFVFSTLVLLIFLNPYISTGTIIFFGILIFFYYKFFKAKLNFLGEKKQIAGLLITKITLESVSSIKEIIVNNKESYFEKIFSEYSKEVWDIDKTHNTLLQVPRYILEFISILSIFLMLFLTYFNEGISNEIFSYLGVFIASVFKLIPSANKILNSLQNLKFSDSALNEIKNKLQTENKNVKNEILKDFLTLEIKNVSFNYPSSKEILNNINLKINKGEFIGIKGESGSGKTTLIDIILGLQKPTKGFLLVNGKINKTIKVGYVPQQTSILDNSIIENVAFGVEGKLHDIKKIERSLKKAEIFTFFKSKKEGLKFTAGDNGSKLSGGQKQRIGIARSLYLEPDLLILDEPTSALDSKTENAILKTLQKISGEVTIILISHNDHLLKGCHKIYRLENKSLKLC